MPQHAGINEERRFAPEEIVTARPEHVASELSGETVILSLDRGIYYGLDPVGTHVWQLIQRPTTVDEVCRCLCQVFDVELERCRQEVAVLLHDMDGAGLLQKGSGVAS